ncbi:MAG: hypothetical protein A3F10_05275 [Coxiella sp. RIFCSPHIGHO2_12_FULL_42_15]|nr:MAG: hypothetical protein A3F10_05275 [Coxiella sp. RIFCSPHIGHO2_12_FULL_42_15]
MNVKEYFNSAAENYRTWIDETLKTKWRGFLWKHDKTKGVSHAEQTYSATDFSSLLPALRDRYQKRASNWIKNRLHRHSFENFLLATLLQALLSENPQHPAACAISEKLNNDFGYSFDPQNFMTAFLNLGDANKFDYLQLLIDRCPGDFIQPVEKEVVSAGTPVNLEKGASEPIISLPSENVDELKKEITEFVEKEKKLEDQLQEMKNTQANHKRLMLHDANYVQHLEEEMTTLQHGLGAFAQEQADTERRLAKWKTWREDFQNHRIPEDFKVQMKVEKETARLIKKLVRNVLLKQANHALRKGLIESSEGLQHECFDFLQAISKEHAMDVSPLSSSERRYLNVFIIFVLVLDDKSQYKDAYANFVPEYQQQFWHVVGHTPSSESNTTPKNYLQTAKFTSSVIVGWFTRIQQWLLTLTMAQESLPPPPLCRQIRNYSNHEWAQYLKECGTHMREAQRDVKIITMQMELQKEQIAKENERLLEFSERKMRYLREQNKMDQGIARLEREMSEIRESFTEKKSPLMAVNAIPSRTVLVTFPPPPPPLPLPSGEIIGAAGKSMLAQIKNGQKKLGSCLHCEPLPDALNQAIENKTFQLKKVDPLVPHSQQGKVPLKPGPVDVAGLLKSHPFFSTKNGELSDSDASESDSNWNLE